MNIKEIWVIWEPTPIPKVEAGDAMSIRGTLFKKREIVSTFETGMTLLAGPETDPDLGEKLVFLSMEGVDVDTIEAQVARQNTDHYLVVNGKKYLLVADVPYSETWGTIHTFKLPKRKWIPIVVGSTATITILALLAKRR